VAPEEVTSYPLFSEIAKGLADHACAAKQIDPRMKVIELPLVGGRYIETRYDLKANIERSARRSVR